MPIDPYFTSANKKYYKSNPKTEAQVKELFDKLMKLSWDEQSKWVSESWHRPITFVEECVRKKMRYNYQAKRRAYRTLRRNRLAYAFKANGGTTVVGGYNIGAR